MCSDSSAISTDTDRRAAGVHTNAAELAAILFGAKDPIRPWRGAPPSPAAPTGYCQCRPDVLPTYIASVRPGQEKEG